MRIWLTIGLIALSIVAARAIPPAQQIIIFGGQSSASGGSGILACGTGVINTSTGCTQPMLGGL